MKKSCKYILLSLNEVVNVESEIDNNSTSGSFEMWASLYLNPLLTKWFLKSLTRCGGSANMNTLPSLYIKNGFVSSTPNL